MVAKLGRYLSRQAALPRGPFGRVLGAIWVNESAAVNDVALELLQPRPGEDICEIGFGPGRTLERLAASDAHVVGVEVSELMLATAARRNADAIVAGRVSLHRGDGVHLPMADNSLDGVLAVHTIYFWPDPASTLNDIVRTLRPGGRVVVAFPAGDHPLPSRFDPTIYKIPTTSEATQWFHDAGMGNVAVERRPEVSPTTVWLSGTAEPSAAPNRSKKSM